MGDFRQAAIDAILEDLAFDSVKELRTYVSKNKQDDYFYGGILYAINAVQDLSSAQPKSEERTAESAQNVPNDELISKKAEIEALIKEFKRSPIELLPAAQPERTGKWIKEKSRGQLYQCSACNNYLDFRGVNAGRGSANYCPNCGARMES